MKAVVKAVIVNVMVVAALVGCKTANKEAPVSEAKAEETAIQDLSQYKCLEGTVRDRFLDKVQSFNRSTVYSGKGFTVTGFDIVGVKHVKSRKVSDHNEDRYEITTKIRGYAKDLDAGTNKLTEKTEVINFLVHWYEMETSRGNRLVCERS